MPFLEALQRAWAEWPPLRKFVAAALGYKPKPPPKRIDENTARELLGMFAGGVIR